MSRDFEEKVGSALAGIRVICLRIDPQAGNFRVLQHVPQPILRCGQILHRGAGQEKSRRGVR